MCTLQATKNSAAQKNWEAIFPSEQVTEQRSALFVKKLLAVAISNITYLRNIFPEKAFGDKCLDDLNLKILRDESTCPGACQVIRWVKGCFDALDKKYLKTLVIGIYTDPNNPQTLIESYTFKFSYEDNGSVDLYRNDKKISGSSAFTAEETRKATIKLLRTLIILTNTLYALPLNTMMTMKLYYYDEVTPKDYEPPGFKASNEDSFDFQDESTNIAIGSVATAFHTVKLRIKTSSKEFGVDEEENEQGNNQSVTEKAEMQDENQSIIQESRNSQSDIIPSNVDNDMPIDEDIVVNNEEYKVRCPCGCNEDDGIMVMCEICKFWQHGTCFLIIDAESAPQTHICDICAQPGDPLKKPTDPQLCGLSSIDVQEICLWRRALFVVTEFKRIMTPELARRLDIEHTVAQGLINRLEKEGFITTQKAKGKKKALGKVVNKDKIETEGITKYFTAPEITEDVLNDENPENADMPIIEKDINNLTNVTQKMNLGMGRKKRNRNSPQVIKADSQVDDTKRKTRKRPHANDINFEIASQEEEEVSKCKKASKVKQDIAL